MTSNEKWEKLNSALVKINSEFGSSLLNEPVKVRALLSDFAPDIPNEVKVFSNVICEPDINRYVSGNSDIQMDYLVSRIKDYMGLSTEWAQKIAVGIFALIGKTVPKALSVPQEVKKVEHQVTSQQTVKTIKQLVKSKPQKSQSYEQQLISSGYSRLTNGLWDKAMESFDSALRTSTYPRAYVGKMMATLHIRKESEIPFCERDFELDPNWIKAKSSATGSYKDKLLRYEREHRSHLNRLKPSKPSKPVQSTTTAKPVVQPQKQASTPNKKEPSNFGMVMCIIGLLLLLATVIFGFYAWFANTGLSLLTYYLIMFGGSCVGTLLAFSDSGFKETLKCLAMFGLGIPAVVTIVGLIIDLIIWVIKLF